MAWIVAETATEQYKRLDRSGGVSEISWSPLHGACFMSLKIYVAKSPCRLEAQRKLSNSVARKLWTQKYRDGSTGNVALAQSHRALPPPLPSLFARAPNDSNRSRCHPVRNGIPNQGLCRRLLPLSLNLMRGNPKMLLPKILFFKVSDLPPLELHTEAEVQTVKQQDLKHSHWNYSIHILRRLMFNCG